MEIKFKLDTEKAAKALVAIAASYRLGQFSEGTEYPQLAFINYCLDCYCRNSIWSPPVPACKEKTPPVCE